MRRTTFVKNIRICTLTLAVATVTAIFTLVEYVISVNVQSDTASADAVFCNPTIIIDAGHGGADGGAVGVSGVLEKDINLEIALSLSSLFELCGFNTVMTRSDDVMLCDEGLESGKKLSDLRNRVKIAQQYENAVFVSIHQNKFPLEKYKGLQVWYSGNNPDSAVIAEIIQNKTAEFLQKDNNRKTKKAGRNIFVLHKLDCPAVLAECGFLSNRNEEKLICDREYQKKLAFLIFSSVSEYVSNVNSKENI